MSIEMPKCNFEKQKQTFEEKQRLIREFVNETYEKSGQPKEKIESFIKHNETVLKYAEELAKEEKLNAEETNALKLSVELHDVSKFDTALVQHGFESAKIARGKLKSLGFGPGTIEKISNAIEKHMGPVPGFMADQAKMWEQKTGEKIEFPRPENEVDKCLYDADMLSLIDEQGIEKILTIRESEEWAIKEDKETARTKNISQKQTAWLSALESGKQAADSLFTETAKKKAQNLLEKAQKAFEIFREEESQK